MLKAQYSLFQQLASVWSAMKGPVDTSLFEIAGKRFPVHSHICKDCP